jgi:catechol 2,3-dioxygenase-like lactoylglutathione lyase family enzyme
MDVPTATVRQFRFAEKTPGDDKGLSPDDMPHDIRLDENSTNGRMTHSLAYVTLVVREYDEAIDFFTRVIGFSLQADEDRGGGKRWVLVGPSGGGASLLLARGATAEQVGHVGNQTGGRVAFFLHTDDFRRDYDAFREHGVRFVDGPRYESYGTVGVFLDLYGNKWDLIERSDTR